MRKLALIAVLACIVVLGKMCLFTVDSSEYAIATDFGKPTQVITTPGSPATPSSSQPSRSAAASVAPCASIAAGSSRRDLQRLASEI